MPNFGPLESPSDGPLFPAVLCGPALFTNEVLIINHHTEFASIASQTNQELIPAQDE